MSLKKRADAIVLKKRVPKLMRALALETTARVVRRTPVDEGRARGNWNLSVGSPDATTNEAATLADVPQKMASNQAAVSRWDPTEGPSWLTNGLPYIGELENGHSQQAPNGMVKMTVNEMREWVRRQARG